MSELIEVVTTFGSRQECDRVARVLIDERLAACIQIGGPIVSCYRWENKIEQSEEWTCTIKSTVSLFETVQRRLRELHSYDEPQIIALPISHASNGYAKWVLESVKQE